MPHLIEPEPPFLWPEPRVLVGHCCYPPPTPYVSVLRRTKELFGVTGDLEQSGVELLEDLLSDPETGIVRLIVAVYPACRTRAADLQRLLHVQEHFGSRLECRILVGDLRGGAPPNVLCILTRDRKQFLITGPTPNLAVQTGVPWHVNFALPADTVTLDEFRKWFDWTWTQAAPLRASTTSIPHLVPATGTPEAAAMWERYRLACLQDEVDRLLEGVGVDPGAGVDQSLERVDVDPQTGEVTVTDLLTGSVNSPTADLELPRLDAVAQEVVRLYERGFLVTIDKTTRIPPLAAPVKAEWLGIEGQKQHGTASRELSCKIQILDERQQRQFDTMRTSIRGLLDRLSYPLADGTRWIPTSARSLLEQEIKRVNDRGQEHFAGMVGESPEEFVDAHRETISADANALYREFHPQGVLPESVIDKIVDELKRRIATLKGGRFVPSCSYASIRVDLQPETAYASPWGQARSLLMAIAEFPRKVFSDHYFLRGLGLDEDALLDAMDVCGDDILQHRNHRRVNVRAKAELGLLKELGAEPISDRAKCEAILCLLRGGGPEEISALVAAAKVEEDQPHGEPNRLSLPQLRTEPGQPALRLSLGDE